MNDSIKLSLAVGLLLSVTDPVRADIFDANVFCEVAKIRTGQLAIRHDSRRKVAFGGLNNGDEVQATGGGLDDKTPIIWYYVKVLKSGNSDLIGREGVVNSRFLTCDWYGWDGFFKHEEAVGN